MAAVNSVRTGMPSGVVGRRRTRKSSRDSTSETAATVAGVRASIKASVTLRDTGA